MGPAANKMDVSLYLQQGLFKSGPVPSRRQFFNLFGQRFVPTSVVDASSILSASVGAVARSQWPERCVSLLRVAPGVEVMDVVKARVGRVKDRLNDARSVAPSYKMWVVADIGDAEKSVTGWVSTGVGSALSGGSFFDGAAWGLSQSDSQEIVKAWIEGVSSEWTSATDSGLMVSDEPPCRDYESWQNIVDQFLTSYERGLPLEGPAALEVDSWRALIDLWRVEVYRIGLFGFSKTSWREYQRD